MKNTKTFTKKVLPHYRWLLRNAPRLSSKNAYDLMMYSYENGYTTLMLWKVPAKEYRKWYKKYKNILKTKIQDETTYIVSSNNKAFNRHALGYSIFANSIGHHIREERDGKIYEIDRIEHIECEYAIIISMEKQQ